MGLKKRISPKQQPKEENNLIMRSKKRPQVSNKMNLRLDWPKSKTKSGRLRIDLNLFGRENKKKVKILMNIETLRMKGVFLEKI